MLELNFDGTNTYRSNRNPELREVGRFSYDQATGQVAFTSGRLQGRTGQIEAGGSPQAMRFYAAGMGYCDVYQGVLPF